MMARMAMGLALATTGALWTDGVGMAQGGPFEINPHPDARTVTWQDQPNEASYRVSGSVVYSDLSCPPSDRAVGETLTFSEDLVADTTSFELPQPESNGALSVKDLTFSIEAVDAEGQVMASDSTGLIVDAFCIEEGLPSTGASLDDGSSSRFVAAAVLLLSFGSICAVSGLVALRRQA